MSEVKPLNGEALVFYLLSWKMHQYFLQSAAASTVAAACVQYNCSPGFSPTSQRYRNFDGASTRDHTIWTYTKLKVVTSNITPLHLHSPFVSFIKKQDLFVFRCFLPKLGNMGRENLSRQRFSYFFTLTKQRD